MVFHGKPNPSTKTTIHEKTKVLKKSKSLPPHLNDPRRNANGSSVGGLKSRIKDMGPICKSRKKCEKDSPLSAKQLAEEDAEFDWVFNFNKAGQVNQEEFLWLSSESLSPLYNVGDFRFMSPRDYSIDERLVSLLSSWVDCSLFQNKRVNFFDGAKANPIKEASGLISLEREDIWVSLINLEGEDSKLISNVESESENLESDFPSPSYKMNSVAEVDASSSSVMSARDDELSSELLSGSVDLDEMNFDEPLMWPFGDKLNWSSTWEFFCQSPRRGLEKSSAFSDGGKKGNSKELWKRRILVASSGLSASKIVEFKRGTRRIAIATRNSKFNHPRATNSNSAEDMIKMMSSGSKQGILGMIGKKQKLGKEKCFMSAKRLRTMSLGRANSCSSSMDFDASGWSVSLINLDGEDSQWISEVESDMGEGLNSNFPSPSFKNQEEALCGSNNWDQMEADEPLFWPYEKDQNWSVALDNFNVSPRKGLFGIEVTNQTSIRVRIHDQRGGGIRRSLIGVSGLSASKITGFKRVHSKKGNAKRVKAMNSVFGGSGRRSFARSVPQKMDVVMENEAEEVAVESMLGLCEFDGHEGIDMEFQIDSFSILEECK